MKRELIKELVTLYGLPGPLVQRRPVELPPGWDYGNDVDAALLADTLDLLDSLADTVTGPEE